MAKNSKIVALNSRKAEQNAQKPPRHLRKKGKELWISIVRDFATELHDRTVVLALCETVDRKTQAQRELDAAGSLTFSNRHGEPRPHPLIAVIRDCNVTIARLRRELALSELPAETRPPALRYGGKK